jgi:hypothetical protein
MPAGKSKEQGGDQSAALTLSLPEFCEVVVRLANIQFRTHVRRKQTPTSVPFAFVVSFYTRLLCASQSR